MLFIPKEEELGLQKKTLNDWLNLPVASGIYKDYFFGYGRVKQTSPLSVQTGATSTTPTIPTQTVTPIPTSKTPPSAEAPQPEKIKQNPIQTITEKIEEIIDKIRSLFEF